MDTDISSKITDLLNEVESFIDNEDFDSELKEDFLVLLEQVKQSPTKENLQVLSKLLKSVSKASLAESVLSLSEMTE